MTSWIPVLAVVFSLAAAIGLDWYLHRQERRLPWIFLYLSVILPFAAGGFHTYTAMVTTRQRRARSLRHAKRTAPLGNKSLALSLPDPIRAEKGNTIHLEIFYEFNGNSRKL